MPGNEFTWENVEGVGIALCKKYLKVEPGTLSSADIHRYATGLGGFAGDPTDFSERKLEAIPSAWTTEFLDRTQ